MINLNGEFISKNITQTHNVFIRNKRINDDVIGEGSFNASIYATFNDLTSTWKANFTLNKNQISDISKLHIGTDPERMYCLNFAYEDKIFEFTKIEEIHVITSNEDILEFYVTSLSANVIIGKPCTTSNTFTFAPIYE